MKKLLLLLLLPLTILSCRKEDSSNVNQDRIYTDYEVFYNANTDKTQVVVRFRFGHSTGTLLELSDSAGAFVMYNNDTLPYNFWYGGHHKEYAGQITGGTFKYRDTDGNQFINSVPTGETIAFPAGFDTINKSQAQTIDWVETALSPDQHVGIFVGSWTWGQDALFYNDADGATNVVMGVQQMSNLALGSSTVYMDRSTALDVAQGTSVGGRIRYKYRAQNATVVVVQ